MPCFARDRVRSRFVFAVCDGDTYPRSIGTIRNRSAAKRDAIFVRREASQG
jgi:hypothetical protein